MSRRKRSTRGKRQQSTSSLLIPIIVGVVVVGVIVAAILAVEQNQRQASATAIIPTDLPIRTVEPLATDPPPFPEVPRIARPELLDKIETGNVVVVDVRGAQYYAEMHIPGALSIPEAEIANRLDELSRDVDLVLY
jgi:hypothetical protein